MPTFHVLIATAGRPSLRRLLDSLRGELSPADAVTVVFDGPEARARSGLEREWLEGHPESIALVDQVPNLGFWGHGIRNAYQARLAPQTTYIMHADDDDAYAPGAFAALRALCADPARLYIAKMRMPSGETIPRQAAEIVPGDIGTPCGVVPFAAAGRGVWESRCGGDGDYYVQVAAAVPHTFLDVVVYLVRP